MHSWKITSLLTEYDSALKITSLLTEYDSAVKIAQQITFPGLINQLLIKRCTEY